MRGNRLVKASQNLAGNRRKEASQVVEGNSTPKARGRLAIKLACSFF
ncbi:hypothetical protein LCGC14_0262680 [marine sediment metagenome]|uniref:Uncharacterized protein n=1 Tax=marine sediment metagenome TaxID=412755 RepID=A0A0F9U5W5_9ZZZZ